LEQQDAFTLDQSQNWRMRRSEGLQHGPISGSAPISIAKAVYFLPPFEAFTIPPLATRRRRCHGRIFSARQLRSSDNRWINFLSLRRDVVTYNFTFGNNTA